MNDYFEGIDDEVGSRVDNVRRSGREGIDEGVGSKIDNELRYNDKGFLNKNEGFLNNDEGFLNKDERFLNSGEGFLKLMKSKLLEELLMEPACFVLLTQIAYRARRVEGLSIKKVGLGEALIGDYRNIGLTRQKYRTALLKLVDWGLITIKTTNKGTVAKLMGKQVFDINEEWGNHESGMRIGSNKEKKYKHTCWEEEEGRIVLGEYGRVELKGNEVRELIEKLGKTRFDEVIKQLDEKIAEGKEVSKNHFVTVLKYGRYLKERKENVVAIGNRSGKEKVVKSASFDRLSKDKVYGDGK
jgi:hypothetical protein